MSYHINSQSFRIIQEINVELYLHLLQCALNSVNQMTPIVPVHVTMHMVTRETTIHFLGA